MQIEKLEFEGVDKPLKYTAVARIEHYGNMNGGHYMCHALRGDGKWYCFNDSNVSEGSFEVTPNTYIVIYNLL